MDLKSILDAYRKWLTGDGGKRAYLRGADLRGADLGGATFCRATIDGATVNRQDIGGPGHILCALTDGEWEQIKAGRERAEAAAEQMARQRSLPQRCQHCNKQHFVPVDRDSWECQRCGRENESVWEVRWGFESTSPLFGAMVVPVVKVIEGEHGDGRTES